MPHIKIDAYYVETRDRIEALYAAHKISEREYLRMLRGESKNRIGMIRLANQLDMQVTELLELVGVITCRARFRHDFDQPDFGPDLADGTCLVEETCQECATTVARFYVDGDLSEPAASTYRHYNYSHAYLLGGLAKGMKPSEFRPALAYMRLRERITAYESSSIRAIKKAADRLTAMREAPAV